MTATELPEGMKVALAIALDELFVERVAEAVAAPEELLQRDDLCASCQGYHRGTLDAAAAAAMLEELRPWLSPELVLSTLSRAGTATAAELGCDLVDAAGIAAGVDLARALLGMALGHEARIPERARPWESVLRPYASALAAKIAARDPGEVLLAAALFD